MDKHAKHFQQGDGQSKIRTVEHIFLHLPTSCNLELFAALSYNLNRQPPHNTTLSIYCRFSNWNHSNGFFIWNHALGLLKIYHNITPPRRPASLKLLWLKMTFLDQNIFKSNSETAILLKFQWKHFKAFYTHHKNFHAVSSICFIFRWHTICIILILYRYFISLTLFDSISK